MFKKLFFLIFIFTSVLGYSQQGDKDNVRLAVLQFFITKDYENAKKVIDTKLISSKNESRKLIGYVELASYYGYILNEEKKVFYLEKAKLIATKSKSDADKAFVNFAFAKYYMQLEQDKLAVKYFNLAVAGLKKLQGENAMIVRLYMDKSYIIRSNPLKNDNPDDYKIRIKYALQSNVPLLIYSSYSSLGTYYYNQYTATENVKYLDSSTVKDKNAQQYINKINNLSARNWAISKYYANEASNLIETKDYKQSIDLFQKALKINLTNENWKSSRTFIYNGLGCNYEKLKQYDIAEKYYLEVIRIANSVGNLEKLKITNLENLTNVNLLQGKYKEALNYQIEAKKLIKSYSIKQKQSSLEALELLYKTKEKEHLIVQLKEDEAANRKKIIFFIIIIILSAIGFVFLMFLMKSKQKLAKQNNELLMAEKMESDLILELEQEEKKRLHAERELMAMQQEQLTKEVLANSLRLGYKDRVISEIKDQIKETNNPTLDRLLKNEKLADDEMLQDQEILKNIHPNFYNKLHEIALTNLTKKDLKYATYLYLNMDNQQIASLLRADINTVRVSKYRFKRKLGLGKDDDVVSYLKNLKL